MTELNGSAKGQPSLQSATPPPHIPVDSPALLSDGSFANAPQMTSNGHAAGDVSSSGAASDEQKNIADLPVFDFGAISGGELSNETPVMNESIISRVEETEEVSEIQELNVQEDSADISESVMQEQTFEPVEMVEQELVSEELVSETVIEEKVIEEVETVAVAEIEPLPENIFAADDEQVEHIPLVEENNIENVASDDAEIYAEDVNDNVINIQDIEQEQEVEEYAQEDQQAVQEEQQTVQEVAESQNYEFENVDEIINTQDSNYEEDNNVESNQQIATSMLQLTELLHLRCREVEDELDERRRRKARMLSGNDMKSRSEVAAAHVDMGALKPLLEDPTVNDILVNSYDRIFVERNGELESTDVAFESHEKLVDLVHLIVEAVGRTIDPKRPLIDARLLDGSRVNIITPPLAIDGVSMSIRKFGGEELTLDRMAEFGSLTKQMAEFLKLCAKSKANIVVSGGTGSGKTTLLNAISKYIGEKERIVTIEDSAELQLKQPHVVRLETKIADRYGDMSSEVTIRDLVKNSLRMRPDRIIVGEVRGSEAFDMIQAMNTGHDGSLTTIHANTPRDGITRIENMIGMGDNNLADLAIRRQIASAVHFIIQTARMDDGVRRITHISEIVGMEGNIITMQDIFIFKQDGIDEKGGIIGQHVWGGMYPRHVSLNGLLRAGNVMTMQG